LEKGCVLYESYCYFANRGPHVGKLLGAVVLPPKISVDTSRTLFLSLDGDCVVYSLSLPSLSLPLPAMDAEVTSELEAAMASILFVL
jgi:hypothetical protein